MARYIVTDSSYYQPFSYDELVKPIQQMTDAHNATADAYDQLSLETEALRNYISENEDDKQAKAMYDNYINKLHALQDNLWNRGYNTGTRRDLSAARAAYASDITRLKTAVQTRQERSKEYWDARHKNPDLVTGFDPGTGGLDNYLADPEYGRNWYSYSGNQFASEVAAEAKARGAELVSTYATQNPALAGYLEYHVKNGFTNAQVNGATLLAQQALAGNVDLTNPNIDPVEALLASTLISRLQSTGAKPGQNLSPEEFGRLFNYGVLGLSQGVGSEDVKPISDKQWDFNMDIAKMNHQAALSEAAAVAKYNREHAAPETGSQQRGYSLDGLSIYTSAPDAAEKNDYYNKSIHNYEADGPVLVTMNGRQTAINNTQQAERLFDAIGKSDIERDFGVDPELQIRGRRASKDKRIEVTRTLADGRQVLFRYVPMTNDQRKGFVNDGFLDESDGYKYSPVAVEQRVDGKWVLNEAITRRFNVRNRAYQKQRDNISVVDKNGKKIDLDKIAMVGETKQGIYKKGDINQAVPVEYAQAVYDTKNEQGIVTDATIADSAMPDALDYYTGKFMEKYAAESSGKGIDKSSRYAFYPLNDSRNGYTDKAETSANSMFNSNGSGDNKTVDYGLVSVKLAPEDVYKTSNPKVRVTTNKGVIRGVDPEYLGNYMSETVKAMRSDQGSGDPKGIIHYLMLPISEPEYVATMNQAEQERWSKFAAAYLGEYIDIRVKDAVGNTIGYIGPKQILLQKSNRDMLRNAVINYMNDELSLARDYAVQNPMQAPDHSSTKASPYVISNR